MLLFMMGIGLDLTIVVLMSVFLFAVGCLVYWLTGKILRKLLSGASTRKVKMLSLAGAVILSPIIILGIFILFIYVAIQTAPKMSDEEMVRNHYEMMEGDIREDLKTGMSKIEVVELFGETDTTQSTLIYDMSLPKAKEKYILEVTFDEGGLKDFRRRL